MQREDEVRQMYRDILEASTHPRTLLQTPMERTTELLTAQNILSFILLPDKRGMEKWNNFIRGIKE